MEGISECWSANFRVLNSSVWARLHEELRASERHKAFRRNRERRWIGLFSPLACIQSFVKLGRRQDGRKGKQGGISLYKFLCSLRGACRKNLLGRGRKLYLKKMSTNKENQAIWACSEKKALPTGCLYFEFKENHFVEGLGEVESQVIANRGLCRGFYAHVHDFY